MEQAEERGRHALCAGLVAFAVAAAAIALPSIGVQPAAAQGFFDRVAGAECARLQNEGGPFWQGFVRGSREGHFTFSDSLNDFTDRHCFRSEADCRDWVYVVRSAAYIVRDGGCRPIAR